MKNLELPARSSRRSCKQYGVRPHDPLHRAGEPVRSVEGPDRRDRGVPHRARGVPDAQLVLAGSMATDDPEGFHYWELADEARAGDPNIHLLSNIQQVGTVQINAFQRAADVVMQKSLREGFGLTVSEGLWKGRPVVGGRCGGITLQIDDGENGYLVDSVEDRGQALHRAAARTRRAPTRWATRAASTCGSNFLSTRELEDWLRLFTELRWRSLTRMIVVSHRGPYRFEPRATTATFAAAPRRRRRRERARAAAARQADATRTWIAAAMSRRRPRRGRASGSHRRPRHRSPPARPRSRAAPACTTTSSRTACSGSCFHGLFDRVRRPRFDLRFREAWDAYVAVNEAFADATADAARRRRRSCSCSDYQLALVPAQLRELPARPARSCTSRTRRSAAPTTSACCPTDVAEPLCALAGERPGRLPHERAGPRRTASRRAAVLGRRRDDRAAVRGAPRPRRRRARRPIAAEPRDARGADALADVGRRPPRDRCAADRIEPSKNIVRGFLAYDRLLEARPGPARPRRVRRDAVPVAPGPRRVPRVRERGRAGRRPRERPLGDARLAADRARRARRLPALGRRRCSATTCCS